MTPQNPPSFIMLADLRKAAFDHGYRLEQGLSDGWFKFTSTTAKGALWLAAAANTGPFYLALDHPAVAAILPPSMTAGPGLTRQTYPTLTALYQTLAQIYTLAATLPDDPVAAFEAATQNLPTTTEAERLTIRRIGQDIFRDRLMTHWNARCPLTGITDAALLRASHIKPWKDCTTTAERLDVYNGLLLSALWDAAFDKGLVSFDNHGAPIFSPHLSSAARTALLWTAPIPLCPAHRDQLIWHRDVEFKT